MTDGTGCFHGDTLSTASYSSLLISMAALNMNLMVTFDGGQSQYSAGGAATARNTTLIRGRRWTITDGGEAAAAQPGFTLVVNTGNPGTSASNAFTLPLNSGYACNFAVLWGDGQGSTCTTAASPTHIYAHPGVYTIAIAEAVPGGFPAISFDNGGDRLKLLQIANWGGVTWSTFANAFYGCSNLTITATDQATANTATVSDFSYAFNGCAGLTSFPALDTVNGTDFSYAWANCSGLTGFPTIDTSQGTDFSNAWNGCSGLSSFPTLATGRGTDFSGAWYSCSGFTSFPPLATSSGTDFSRTWFSCGGLSSFPNLDTGRGASFSFAWAGCTHLASFPTLATGSGVDFSGAWYDCTGLTSFPTLDTSLGTNFQSAWGACTGLTSFPSLDTGNGTNFIDAWNDCPSLTAFPTLNMAKMMLGSECFHGDTLSASTYSSLLRSLAAANTNIAVTFDGGLSQYFPGAAEGARDTILIQGRGWTITDGGMLTASPVITSPLIAGDVVYSLFSYQITASNAPNSFAALGLPAGLSLDAGTGTITGTPTAAGTSLVTITASNSNGTGSATLTLTVSGNPPGAPVIDGGIDYAGIVGQPVIFHIIATNSPTSYAATGLPTGLSINTLTGEITGTPTAVANYYVNLYATNAVGTGTATLTLDIAADQAGQASDQANFFKCGGGSGLAALLGALLLLLRRPLVAAKTPGGQGWRPSRHWRRRRYRCPGQFDVEHLLCP